MKQTLCLLALCLFAAAAQANYTTEPSFCKLDNFFSLEQKADRKGLIRDRQYKIGGLTLTGLAVGKSSVTEMKNLATKLSKSTFEKTRNTARFILIKEKKNKRRNLITRILRNHTL